MSTNRQSNFKTPKPSACQWTHLRTRKLPSTGDQNHMSVHFGAIARTGTLQRAGCSVGRWVEESTCSLSRASCSVYCSCSLHPAPSSGASFRAAPRALGEAPGAGHPLRKTVAGGGSPLGLQHSQTAFKPIALPFSLHPGLQLPVKMLTSLSGQAGMIRLSTSTARPQSRQIGNLAYP